MELSKNKIKTYRLLQQKKQRDKEGLYVIEGRKMVFEALDECKEDIIDIICTENFSIDFPDIRKHAYSSTDAKTFKQISSLSNPQGVMAVLRKPSPKELSPEKINDLTIALDGINDPGNLGTIIRLADWFGIKNIICSKNSVDMHNPKTIQSTMGSIFRVKVFYTDLKEFITLATESGLPAYGTTLDGDNLYQPKLNNKAILVMGNEANGISPEIRNILKDNLYIPAYGESGKQSESLNISIATSVIISEFRRQQFYSK